MADASLVSQINDWLNDQALSEPDALELFEGLCHRLNAIGIPIGRAWLIWSTLHPLFQAESVLWRRGKKPELGQFIHQDTASEAWERSPMSFMLKAGIPVLRRKLVGPGKLLDFPILEDLEKEGYSDYLLIATDLYATAANSGAQDRRGIFISWASDRSSGFTDDDLSTLQRIQRRLAVACKTMIQARISRNVADAYLGRQTGEKVLQGSIRLGDGEETRALVWYSDLRSSTRLAETMPSPEFLELLNVYFECAARPVIAASGEVLAFIGDAVLGIFPFTEDAELPELTQRVLAALRDSLEFADRTNTERAASGQKPIAYGIGLNVGTVMYGNIGIPERLAFSAVGPTVIEVARIEKLTKTLDARVLATAQVAGYAPRLWRSMGRHRLEGVLEPQEIFGFREEATQEAA
jgi:adenylate cyclase